MVDRSALGFRWWDAPILLVGIALGVAAVGASQPLVTLIADSILSARRLLPDQIGSGLVWSGLHLLAAGLAPLTWVLALLPVLRRGDHRRQLARLPGVVACRAVAVVLILEALICPLNHYLLIYGEMCRVQGSATNNIVQLPRALAARSGDPSWVIAAVLFPLGSWAGFAALGVLSLRWVGGGPLPPASAWNRLGVGLGCIWIAIALGYQGMPLP